MKEYADRIKSNGALAYFEFCHESSQVETKEPYVPWGLDEYIREDGGTMANRARFPIRLIKALRETVGGNMI